MHAGDLAQRRHLAGLGIAHLVQIADRLVADRQDPAADLDAAAAAAVPAVDAARAVLFYAFVFGQSLLVLVLVLGPGAGRTATDRR